MKVYYTSSSPYILGEGAEIYKKTLNYISFKVGKKNVNSWQFAGLVGEDVNMSEVIKKVKDNDKHIRDCDVFIADITKGSPGLGFEIGKALNEKKQILVVKRKGDAKLGYGGIAAGLHKSIVYREYETIEELTSIIDEFVEEAKAKVDTKFILIIPADIDKYLSWASDFRRMHKAQVVRKAIETVMQKDKDWKDYSKQRDN